MSARVPSLNWLRVFEAAARAGSFARAAERLAMSPPAVSQQIRALEAHLGRPLFERAAAGVRLTEAGRILLGTVGDALGRMEAAAAAVAAPGGAPLVLAASATLSVGWLAPRLPAFLAAHPQITLEVFSMLGRPELPPRQAEIWIGFGQPSAGTEAEELFGEILVPVAHPALAAQISTPEDFLAFPLIEVADHMRNWAQVFEGAMVPQGARVLNVDTTAMALALAASRGGVALARAPASDALLEVYGLVPCLSDFEIGGIEAYHVIHTAGVPLSAGAAAFRTWVLAEAASSIPGGTGA